MARTCTLKGNPLELAGTALEVGKKAPDAALRKNLLTDMKLGELKGKKRIYSVVPSLDTPVCAEQTKRFNQEMASHPDVAFVTISNDLPTAQARFCGEAGIDTEKFTVLSDHKDLEFGNAYGTLIPSLRVQSRAAFVVDADDTIRYAEYVPEVASHPNYEAILNCVKSL